MQTFVDGRDVIKSKRQYVIKMFNCVTCYGLECWRGVQIKVHSTEHDVHVFTTPFSAIGETQCESGFVAKDHCVPLFLSESDMTSSPQKSLLTMYTGENGTEVWPSGSVQRCASGF